ncbi:hypothetical protein QR680_017879 [Steinernema hermaphroditum]|uniref:VWFD domain-containing protein n=1 Tax=Steinernema hermaphroditum TaxID=289476 RepID=A0AA39HG58_9BILA|nr:hypothetical protein QR680_017879 [Steinernema hermaphroditum]
MNTTLFLGLLAAAISIFTIEHRHHNHRHSHEAHQEVCSNRSTRGGALDCRVQGNTVGAHRKGYTIPFTVTNCDVLVAAGSYVDGEDTGKLKVFLRQEKKNIQEKKLTIVYEGNVLEVHLKTNLLNTYFDIRLNDRIVNYVNLFLDYGRLMIISRGIFIFRRRGATVSFDGRDLALKGVFEDVHGLCATGRHHRVVRKNDCETTDLRAFHRDYIVENDNCRVDLEEMARLPYRMNTSISWTQEEKDNFEDIATTFNATPKEMDDAKAACWYEQELPGLRVCLKHRITTAQEDKTGASVGLLQPRNERTKPVNSTAYYCMSFSCYCGHMNGTMEEDKCRLEDGRIVGKAVRMEFRLLSDD